MSPKSGARVLGYVRVSTEDQAREGVSLDVQEQRLRDYCRAREWELVGVTRDEGCSAKDLKRPGLQEILHALPKRQRGWEALIVVKLDRLTRSVRDLANLMEMFKRARVGFNSIQETVDTSSASGELFFNLVASVSQWERRAIGERTHDTMSQLSAAKATRVGSIPYGYRLDPAHVRQVRPSGRQEAARLIPDEREQAALAEIRILATHLSLRAMAAALTSRGILARCGKPFAPQTLRQLVSKGAPADSRGR